MLVMSLKEGDYVLIGDNIKVYFEHKVSRDVLDIAISAPKDVLILRGKIHEKAKTNAAEGVKRRRRTG